MKAAIILALLAPLAMSFLFSTFRAASVSSTATCKKVGIDKLEPVISTRWFCELE